jgi:hypothetical protein
VETADLPRFFGSRETITSFPSSTAALRTGCPCEGCILVSLSRREPYKHQLAEVRLRADLYVALAPPLDDGLGFGPGMEAFEAQAFGIVGRKHELT